MASEPDAPAGPDLGQGVPFDTVPDGGMVVGHAGGEAVLLARKGEQVFAIGATCTHYSGPLAEGLIVGDTVRCPWHHACFSLRTGEALRAPALSPVPCFRVERRGGMVFVHEKLARPAPHPLAASSPPQSVVIIGGGAAGLAAAVELRKLGYSGALTMVSADDSAPYDRPNLSKGYLAGSAEEDWLPLRSANFYKKQGVDLKLGVYAAALFPEARRVGFANGSDLAYDALLLATGAEPVRLNLPGSGGAHVHYLRTLSDCRAIIAQAQAGQRAVVIGASFIGLEAAAALRARNVDVDVVAPETLPMERILGADVGTLIRQVHESHGVTFHLGTTAASISVQSVTLQNGETLKADFVLIGVGVRPLTALAEQARLAMDRGILVNEYLETSAPGIYAAGDIARWPDRLTGEAIRIEHFVVAERQGQTAARNILGARERFDAVPFFWTEQYDFVLGYVGHAARWDKAEIEGNLEGRDCTVSYSLAGKKLAVATIGRDKASLEAEAAFERVMAAL